VCKGWLLGFGGEPSRSLWLVAEPNSGLRPVATSDENYEPDLVAVGTR
jgi:hypothetical protein